MQNPSSVEEEEEQNPQQEWEAMARAWLCAFPEAREISTSEVEAWVDSNRASLPTELRHMPRSEVAERLLAIQTMLRPPSQQPQQNQENHQEKEASHADGSHARFQRTDQWRPVYAWLESLDRTEVVKSKDISEWLNQNPEVKEQLCSRHSRYHLMHYVKKCHVKIIKRKQKKKGLQQAGKAISLSPQASTVMKPPTQSSPKLRNVPKDSELYVSKRNEALRKYQLLVELEAYFQVRWRGNDKTQ